MGKATGGGAAGLSPLPGRTHQTGAWPPAPGCSSSPGPWGGPAGGAQGPRHRRPGIKGLRASRRGSAARRPAWCSRCLRVHHPLNPLKWHASQASVQHWPWPWPCAAHAPRSTPREHAICVPAHIFSARPLPRHTTHNSTKTLTHTHTHTSLPQGLTRWEVSTTRAPLPTSCLMVGSEARMRVSSVMARVSLFCGNGQGSEGQGNAHVAAVRRSTELPCCWLGSACHDAPPSPAGLAPVSRSRHQHWPLQARHAHVS